MAGLPPPVRRAGRNLDDSRKQLGMGVYVADRGGGDAAMSSRGESGVTMLEVLVAIVLLSIAPGAIGLSYTFLLPVVVRDLGAEPGSIGLLYIGGGIGGLLSGLVAEPIMRRVGHGRAIFVGLTTIMFGLVGVGTMGLNALRCLLTLYRFEEIRCTSRRPETRRSGGAANTGPAVSDGASSSPSKRATMPISPRRSAPRSPYRRSRRIPPESESNSPHRGPD